MGNYIEMKKFSIRGDKYFCFLDTKDYLADQVFIRNQFRVYFMSTEFVSPDERYSIIFCHVRKKDVPKFKKSMGELKNKMLLLGYDDYLNYCESIFSKISKKD